MGLYALATGLKAGSHPHNGLLLLDVLHKLCAISSSCILEFDAQAWLFTHQSSPLCIVIP